MGECEKKVVKQITITISWLFSCLSLIAFSLSTDHSRLHSEIGETLLYSGTFISKVTLAS